MPEKKISEENLEESIEIYDDYRSTMQEFTELVAKNILFCLTQEVGI